MIVGRRASRPACVIALTLLTAPLSAQVPGSPHAAETTAIVTWRNAGFAAVGVVALLALDGRAQRIARGGRSAFTDDVAGGVRRFGEWPSYAALPVAITLAGLATNSDAVTATGLEMAGAVLVTMGIVLPAKQAFGRARPLCECGTTTFEPLGPGRSMPSGHTAAAFAVANSLGDRIGNGWARAGLLTLAGLVGWSRMNDEKHWLSDVVVGALVGTVSAKLVNGRWRVFGRGRPELRVAPDGTSVGWRVAF